MQGMQNELRKLRELRDNDRKIIKGCLEQLERLSKEYEDRVSQVQRVIDDTQISIDVWDKLIQQMEVSRES